MSAKDSFLMQEPYHYHMVVATSQETINAILKKWYLKLAPKAFSQAYLWKETDAQPTPADLTRLGVDPFTIKHNTAASDPGIQKLIEQGFCCAFSATPGTKGMTLAVINKTAPMAFTQEGTQVRFSLLCNRFTIAALVKQSNGTWQWLLIEQNIASPWVAGYDVQLSMYKDKLKKLLKDLPPYASALSAGNPDMFNIQKLIVNLSSAVLHSAPEIAQINTYDKIKKQLAAFLPALAHNLGVQAEATIGWSLLADKTLDTGKGSLVPTDAKFIISAYKDKNGNATSDYKYYTLNYLFMTMGMAMPPVHSFKWNWIDADEKKGGIIAINRGVFALYLKDQLKSSLAELFKKLQVKISSTGDRLGITHEFAADPNQPELTPHFTQFLPNETARCSYQSEGRSTCQHRFRYDTYTVECVTSYAADVSVKFDNTTLRFNYHIKVGLNISFEPGSSTLYTFYDRSVTRCYTMGVNSQGEMALTLSDQGASDTTSTPALPDKLRINFGALADTLKNNLQTSVTSMLDKENTVMLDKVRKGINWIFPGTDTFTFSHCYFSGKEDLITEINYAAIS